MRRKLVNLYGTLAFALTLMWPSSAVARNVPKTQRAFGLTEGAAPAIAFHPLYYRLPSGLGLEELHTLEFHVISTNSEIDSERIAFWLSDRLSAPAVRFFAGKPGVVETARRLAGDPLTQLEVSVIIDATAVERVPFAIFEQEAGPRAFTPVSLHYLPAQESSGPQSRPRTLYECRSEEECDREYLTCLRACRGWSACEGDCDTQLLYCVGGPIGYPYTTEETTLRQATGVRRCYADWWVFLFDLFLGNFDDYSEYETFREYVTWQNYVNCDGSVEARRISAYHTRETCWVKTGACDINSLHGFGPPDCDEQRLD